MAATVAQALRFDGELASRLLAQAPRWVMGLLVVLLGVQVALFIAQLSGPPGMVATGAPVAPMATRKIVDIPSILRANLFGQSAPGPGAVNAPVTNLQLTLNGVIADTDEKRGFALLTAPGTNTRVYKVGDALPGGARLHAVQVDRVLLDRGGTIEALPLPPRNAQLLTASTPPPAVQAAPLERMQQAMRDRPGLLGQVIQRQAVFAEGRLRGMRVYPGPDAAAFDRLGLRPGDLVTAINGSPLDDQSRSAEVFSTLGNSAEAHVTVVRNGTQQELTLNLAEVAHEAERLAVAPQDTAPPPEADTPAPVSE
jgi:general secretion pathway protein C